MSALTCFICFLAIGVVLIPTMATSSVNTCVDRLKQNTCDFYLENQYCTTIPSLKGLCAKTCGWCCANGTQASGPYGKGCEEQRKCYGLDRLDYRRCERLVNSTKLKCSGDIMKFACESTCKWCCIDRKTLADGPGKTGCGYKLCYNVKSDDYCADQANTSSTFCDKKINQENCAWTCKVCKAPSPKQTCEQLPPSKRPYGCCWNGELALRPPNYPGDLQGCPRCDDVRPHTCNQFGQFGCGIGQYRTRSFLHQYCPKTCGFC